MVACDNGSEVGLGVSRMVRNYNIVFSEILSMKLTIVKYVNHKIDMIVTDLSSNNSN